MVAQTPAVGLSIPQVIPDGDDQMSLFHLADKDGVWHRAKMKIEGETVVVTSSEVSEPNGVAYGSRAGNLPNLYNRALLPTTPFIYYDHQLVTSETTAGKPLRIAGEEPRPHLMRPSIRTQQTLPAQLAV